MINLWILAILMTSVAAQSGHPEFDPPMEQVVLREGFKEQVECIARGELPLTYKWYNQRDVEIASNESGDVFTRRSENGSFLIFAEVEPSHAGLYSCSATNRHGSASKPYDFTVSTDSGNITTNETDDITGVKLISVTESSVEFYVRMAGDPDSFYITYSETVEKEEKSVQIKKGEKAIVKDLVPGGRYVFVFRIERGGPSSTSFDVTLLPGVPDVIFRNLQGGSVEVEWFRSIDDLSRSTIEEYELSYHKVYIAGGRSWIPRDCTITIKIPLRDCSAARYTIAGLARDSYYEIRLKVRTGSGFGKPYTNKVYIQ